MRSTSLSTIFEALIDALKASDPNAFRKIILDDSYDLLQSVFIEQRALGELLAYGHENLVTTNLEQVGWLMVAWAEVGLIWYRNGDNVAQQKIAADVLGTDGGTDLD